MFNRQIVGRPNAQIAAPRFCCPKNALWKANCRWNSVRAMLGRALSREGHNHEIDDFALLSAGCSVGCLRVAWPFSAHQRRALPGLILASGGLLAGGDGENTSRRPWDRRAPLFSTN